MLDLQLVADILYPLSLNMVRQHTELRVEVL